MAQLKTEYLEELETYMRSGQMAEDFEYVEEERRYEMLDFLEKLMDLAELADETATKLIFKGSSMEMLTGVKAPEGQEGGGSGA